MWYEKGKEITHKHDRSQEDVHYVLFPMEIIFFAKHISFAFVHQNLR